ncbi:MAG TPA: hypothetical protein VIH42_07270 [Thermoguttaceae bacterium]
MFISPFVLEEASIGDTSAVNRRLEVLREIKLLETNPETIGPLMEKIHSSLGFPPKAQVDAIHLAYAVNYQLDFLLSWNCTHLANAVTLRRLADFCRTETLWLPIICTPAEMVQQRKGIDDVY